ncbi:MAG: hypothetical protein IKU25_05345 [Clostridia bacterium]|nr:hypothetical protein [Clostridia bacterium]
MTTDRLNSKNFYAFNPGFDKKGNIKRKQNKKAPSDEGALERSETEGEIHKASIPCIFSPSVCGRATATSLVRGRLIVIINIQGVGDVTPYNNKKQMSKAHLPSG